MFLRVAYMLASFGQLGLAAVDLSKALVPTLQAAGAKVVLAVTNPREALRQAGEALSRGVAAAGAGIKSAFAKVGQFFAHPGASVQQGQVWVSSARTGVADGFRRAWDVTKKSASLLKKKLDEAMAAIRGEAPPAPQRWPQALPPAPVPAPAPAYAPIGASLPAPAAGI